MPPVEMPPHNTCTAAVLMTFQIKSREKQSLTRGSLDIQPVVMSGDQSLHSPKSLTNGGSPAAAHPFGDLLNMGWPGPAAATYQRRPLRMPPETVTAKAGRVG